jgi:hypothetical protein
MPIFEYVCRECNHRFELLVQGSVEAPVQSAAPPRSTNNFLHLGSARRVAGPRRPAEEAPVAAAEIREDREPVR